MLRVNCHERHTIVGKFQPAHEGCSDFRPNCLSTQSRESGIRLQLQIKCPVPYIWQSCSLLYFVFQSCYQYKTCESLVATGSSNCCPVTTFLWIYILSSPPPTIEVSEKQVMIGKHCLTPLQFCFYVENTVFFVSGSLAHKMKMCSSEHIFLTALCSKVGGPWLLLFQWLRHTVLAVIYGTAKNNYISDCSTSIRMC